MLSEGGLLPPPILLPTVTPPPSPGEAAHCCNGHHCAQLYIINAHICRQWRKKKTKIKLVRHPRIIILGRQKTGESRVQSYPWPHSKFKARLSHMRLYLKHTHTHYAHTTLSSVACSIDEPRSLPHKKRGHNRCLSPPGPVPLAPSAFDLEQLPWQQVTGLCWSSLFLFLCSFF